MRDQKVIKQKASVLNQAHERHRLNERKIHWAVAQKTCDDRTCDQWACLRLAIKGLAINGLA